MNPEAIVRPAARAAYQVLEGRAVIVATRTRTVHRLDEVGTDLWRFLEPGRRVRQIVDFLLEHYDVDPESARRDVQEFLEELAGKDLVEVAG